MFRAFGPAPMVRWVDGAVHDWSNDHHEEPDEADSNAGGSVVLVEESASLLLNVVNEGVLLKLVVHVKVLIKL